MVDLAKEMRGLNDEISGLFPGYQLDLSELFGLLAQGKIIDVMKMLFQGGMQSFWGECESLLQIAAMLICIGLLSSLLVNLTELFENKQIADIGFYFVYLFLLLVLMRIFGVVADTAQTMIGDMLLFMKLFMPVYFLAVGAAGGVSTALLGYQMILALIYGVESALSALLMPLVRIYIFLAFMNGLWTEERLNMQLDLIKKAAGYLLKLSFAVVTGIGLLQTMILPVIASMKMSAVQKTISLIPGIGNISDSVAEMVLGSAVLIRNSAGALAILLLVALCAFPVAKIWLLAMMLKASAAFIGIFSDKRITSCMDRVGEGSLLVLRILLTASGLFLITIAVAATANRGY